MFKANVLRANLFFLIFILFGVKSSFSQCIPTQTSGTFTFSSAACNSMTIRYNNKSSASGGATTKIIIFAQAGGSCAVTPPSCNTAYSSSTVFGSGTQIGTTGQYCVYISNGAIGQGSFSPSISVTGLQPGTTYYFSAYAWCGGVTGTSPNFTTITGSSCSASTNVFNVQSTAAACSSYTTTGTAVAPITGAGTLCAGATLNLSSTTTGGTWTSSNTPVATINSSTGVVTAVDPGTSTITYTAVTSPGGCTGYRTTTVTVDGKVVAPIGGTSNMCEGTTQTLTDATTGGTWKIINGTGSASISSGGVISSTSANGTGSTGGTVNAVYYFPTNGCPASDTLPITIYPYPGPISSAGGSDVVCTDSPLQLSNSISGGTWAITAGSSYATISSSGLVTGTTQGGPVTVTYTIGGTCSKTLNLNVYNTPNSVNSPITGNSTVCVNATTTYSNSTSGGKWYVTNGTGSAEIDSTTGVLTGLTAGTIIVNYSVINGGCAATVTKSVTVNSIPTVSVSGGGPTSWCSGANPQFTNATAGGTWSSDTTSVATINAATGVVSPVSPGSTNIIYTVTVGGCTNRDTVVFTYTSTGTISDVTGGSVCSGTTRNLTASASGSIQWYLSTDGGTTYNAISGATFNTYTTQTLSYPTVYMYKALVAGSCYTNVLTLTPQNNTVASATGGYACNGSFTMNASGTGTWSLVKGSGTITTPTNPNTTVTNVGNGYNTFRWTVGSGSCSSYIDVSVVSGVAYVAASQSCVFTDQSINLIANTYFGSLQWQQSTDGTNWTNIVGATTDTSATPTLIGGTTYYFRAAVTDTNACTSYSSTVTVNSSYCTTYCSPCTSCSLSSSSCTQTISSSSSTAITVGPTDVYCFTGGTFTGTLKMVGGTIIVYSGATFAPASISMSIIPSNNGTIEIKSGGTFTIPSGGFSTIWSKPFYINNCGTVNGSGNIRFSGQNTKYINNAGTWNATGSLTLNSGTLCNSGTMSAGAFSASINDNAIRNSGTLTLASVNLPISDIYLCPNSIMNVTGTMRVSIGSVTGVASCATLNVYGGSTWSISTLTGVNICDSKANTSSTPQVKSWSGSSTASNNTYCTCLTFPLPIELLYFEARMVNKVVKLNWITESEVNNDYFTVERSEDGENFETVDIVRGAGNSTRPLSYRSVDEHPFQGTSYYRLKQTDYDGQSTYSRIIPVNWADGNKLNIAYFNAMQDQILYQVTGAEGLDLSIDLLDIFGRSVYSELIAGADDSGFNIPLPGLAHGVYILRVTDGQQVATKKFFY